MTTLVPSLLRAIIDVDGEALVMHAGERPYVVAPSGQVKLAKKLTREAVRDIVAQLLPVDASRTLEETGSVQHEIVSPPEFSGETFVVVAAYAGDDAWVEIRRRKIEEVDVVPEEVFAPAARRLAIAATVRRVTEAASVRRGEFVAPPPLPPPSILPPPPSPPAAVPPRTPQLEISSPLRADASRATGAESASGLERLLRIAAARGASSLYLRSNSQPEVRVDGELQVLEGEPPVGPDEVESLLCSLHDVRDVGGVGRVRGTTFRDQRGPGGVFRITPAQDPLVERPELSPEVLSLALEARGLVLVVAPRLNGRRTTITALVGHMNRMRRDYVVTIEREIDVTHDRGTSIVSQREVGGGDDEAAAAVRQALREDPDVLVIDSIATPPLVQLALGAAASGRLVIAGLDAGDSASALRRIVNLHPAESQRQTQLALAEDLRGVVAQALLRSADGRQVAAREVLLNTAAVASVIAEGRLSQLPKALDAGRSQGMRRLNDSLADLVRNGTVDMREAHRTAVDKADLLARLKRLGLAIDERLEL